MSAIAVQQLRTALAVSPENVPLRIALADLLLALGQPAEAEQAYRDAQKRKPADADVKAGLAQAFYDQGKCGEAMVLAEDLAADAHCPPRARLLYARLLQQSGGGAAAAAQYHLAIAADPALADPAFAARLPTPPADMNSNDQDQAPTPPGRQPQTWEGDAPQPTVEIERPTVNFLNVGGLDGVKEEIRLKIVHPLQHPDLYRAYGKTIGGGILMYGPPGCGKTFLARATAGEVKAAFIAVGINDVLDMWIGSSEKNLHAVFAQARAQRPCVLFFDEVDALAASRTDMRTHAGRHLINQFLAELDGVKTSNDGVLVLAATNAPWHVDPAFRRPGRFDRVLFIPPPDAPGRAAILRTMLAGKPVDRIDHDAVARKTDGFSGADLKAVIDQAIEAKLRQSMADGIPKPLTTKDLLTAAASLQPTTREWFNTARNYVRYANQSGAYDDIMKHLKA